MTVKAKAASLYSCEWFICLSWTLSLVCLSVPPDTREFEIDESKILKRTSELFLFVIIADRNRYNRGNALGDDTSGGQGQGVAATDGGHSSNKVQWQWTCFGAILIIWIYK